MPFFIIFLIIAIAVLAFFFSTYYIVPQGSVAIVERLGKYHKTSTAGLHFCLPLGIDKLINKFPYEVSGGQRQRVAVARAIITNPALILADEPTGALDSKSTDQLLEVFEKLNNAGQTIIMVTHSVKTAARAKRVLFIKDGVVFHELRKGNATTSEMFQKINDTLTLMQAGE